MTGVLAALLVRGKTGEGQRIDVSLLDALVHAQASGLGAWFLKRGDHAAHRQSQPVLRALRRLSVPGRQGDRHHLSVGQVLRAISAARSRSTWTADPRFATIAARLATPGRARRRARRPLPRLRRATTCCERLIAADVLAAPIHEIPEVAADVQVRHNDMIVATEHATLGRLEVTGVPIKLRGTPGQRPPARRRCTASTRSRSSASSATAPPRSRRWRAARTIGRHGRRRTACSTSLPCPGSMDVVIRDGRASGAARMALPAGTGVRRAWRRISTARASVPVRTVERPDVAPAFDWAKDARPGGLRVASGT